MDVMMSACSSHSPSSHTVACSQHPLGGDDAGAAEELLVRAAVQGGHPRPGAGCDLLSPNHTQQTLVVRRPRTAHCHNDTHG